MENLIYVVLAASVVALSFAYIFFRQMMKESEGTELMQQIAAHVRKGAMAYLKQEGETQRHNRCRQNNIN